MSTGRYDPTSLSDVKRRIRAEASLNRHNQENREELSRAICEKLAGSSQYAAAETILIYVDIPPEVQTRHFFPSMRAQNKRLVIPYCCGDELKLFRLDGMEELTPKVFEILEPRDELRDRADRAVEPAELDLVVTPGVAFDPSGGRVGHGRGYFDRLFCQVRPDTYLVGLAFECQLFPKVAMGEYDVYVHKVITEKAVYERSASG